MGLFEVAGPYRRGQAVDRVVGHRDRFVFGVEHAHRRHRAEDLFAADGHRAGGTHEQRGLHEGAAGDRATAAATHGHLRALALALRDAGQHVALLLVADQRAHRGGRVERVARAVGHRCAAYETLDEFVMDLTLHQQARAGVAHLAGVVVDATDRALHRGVQVVQVGEEDLRALAAGLQRNAFHVRLPGVTEQQFAHGRGAGERELGHVRVQRQRLAGLDTHSVDHVEHARRAARLDEQCGQPQARHRGLFGRLEHDAVAGGQDRRDLPHRHQHRVVPGRDRAHHAQRLVHDQVQRGRVGVGDRAFDLVDAFGKVADRPQHFGNVDVQHVADRLAHVQCFEQRQFVGVPLHQVGESKQHVHARARRQSAPAAVAPGRQRTRDRGIDVGRLAPGHLRQHAAVGRIDAVEGLAGYGRHMAPVDEQAGGGAQFFGPLGPLLVRVRAGHAWPGALGWVPDGRGAPISASSSVG